MRRIVEIHPEPEPVIEQPKEEPKKKEPIEISEDKVLDTKFTLSVQTMVVVQVSIIDWNVVYTTRRDRGGQKFT